MSPRITTAQLTAHRRGKPLPRPEREVQGAVLSYLRTVPGVMAWRTNTGAAMLPGHDGRGQHVRFGFKGLSDIVGWFTQKIPLRASYAVTIAQFLAVECKRPGRPTTREQAAFLQAVRDAGGIAIVATCVEDVRKVLQP